MSFHRIIALGNRRWYTTCSADTSLELQQLGLQSFHLQQRNGLNSGHSSIKLLPAWAAQAEKEEATRGVPRSNFGIICGQHSKQMASWDVTLGCTFVVCSRSPLLGRDGVARLFILLALSTVFWLCPKRSRAIEKIARTREADQECLQLLLSVSQASELEIHASNEFTSSGQHQTAISSFGYSSMVSSTSWHVLLR